jgi:hypothetical protein
MMQNIFSNENGQICFKIADILHKDFDDAEYKKDDMNIMEKGIID